MSPRLRLARSLACFAALAASGTPARAESEAFALDPATSHVRIHLGRTGLLKFLGHEHHIEAPIAEGRVEVGAGDPARSSVRLRFESARLAVIPGSEPASDIPKVDERMRGPEVLEVARHPEIAFASTSVRSQALDAGGFRLVVAGTLSLKGRAFPVEVPLEARRVDGGIEARGELSLNLRDVGIEPPSVAGVVKVANRFRLELEIRASAVANP
jgi:polyisoprenoid-binding protein YceI